MSFLWAAPETVALWGALSAGSLIRQSRTGMMLSLLSGLGLIWFYRGWNGQLSKSEQHRRVLTSSRVLLQSPCDGVVLSVKEHDHQTQVAVFLNIHNIHVQYAPCSGIVQSITHQSGTFHPAFFFEKSQYNERLITTLESAMGNVRIEQIAGQIARRCVSFLEPGQSVSPGDPMGLIKFGSRVDMWFPKTWKTIVNPGQRLHIGDAVALVGAPGIET